MATSPLFYSEIPDPFTFQYHSFKENDVALDPLEEPPTPYQENLLETLLLEEHCLKLSKKNMSKQEDNIFATYTFFDNLEKDLVPSNTVEEKDTGIALCTKKTRKPERIDSKKTKSEVEPPARLKKNESDDELEDSLGLWLESFYIDSEKPLRESNTAVMFQKMIIKQLFQSRKIRSSVSKKHRKKLIQKSLVSEFHKKSDNPFPAVHNTEEPHNECFSQHPAKASFPMILNGKFKGTLDKRCLKCMFYKKKHGKRVRQSELHLKSGQLSFAHACLCQTMTIKPSRLKYS
ncbi:hypothetical protein ACO0QE_004203 [Hanseniaspora vineae]